MALADRLRAAGVKPSGSTTTNYNSYSTKKKKKNESDSNTLEGRLNAAGVYRETTPAKSYNQPANSKNNFYYQQRQQTPSYTSNPLVTAAQNKVKTWDNSYVTGSAAGDRSYQDYLMRLENQYKSDLLRYNKNDAQVQEQEKKIQELQNQLMEIGRRGDVAGTYQINQELANAKSDLSKRRSELSSQLPDFNAQQAYYNSMSDDTLRAYQERVGREKQDLINRMQEEVDAGNINGSNWTDLLQYTQPAFAADEEVKRVQSMIDQRDWNNKYQQYMGLRNSPNFDGSYQSTYNDNGQYVDPRGNLNGVGEYVSTEMNKYGDITYDYLNNDPNAEQVMHTMNPYGFRTGYGEMNSYYATLTDEEKEVFNHLYKQDPNKAYEFMDFMKDELEKRERQNNEQAAAEFATENPVAASMMSVTSAMGSPIAVASDLVSLAKTGEFNTNSWANQFSYIPQAIRTTVSNNIAENSPLGEAGSFLYNTGMSMADNIAQMLFTGGMSQSAILALMGTQVFANTVTEGVADGKNAEEILMDAFVRAGVEVLTEKIGLDEVFEYLGGTRSFVQLMKAAGSEGAEEALADLLNWGFDGIRQVATGRESELREKYNAYLLQGFSESDALGRVLLDMAKEVGTDALGGALSGLAMSGAGVAVTAPIGAISNARTETRVGEQLRQMLPENHPLLYETDRDIGKRVIEEETTRRDNARAAEFLNEMSDAVNENGSANPDQIKQIMENAAAVKILEENTSAEKIETGLDAQQALAEYAQTHGTESSVEEESEKRQGNSRPINVSTDTSKSELRNRDIMLPLRQYSEVTPVQEIERNRIDTMAAERFGEAGSQVWRSAVQNAGIDAFNVKARQELFNDFAKVFNAGMNDQAIPEGLRLSDDIAQAAYASGQNAALDVFRDKSGRLEKEFTTSDSKKPGLEINSPLVREAIQEKLISRKDLKGFGEMGVRLETKLVPMEHMPQNGWYQDGKIGFSLDASNGLFHVLSHEFTHRLQEAAPEEYEKLKNHIAEFIGSEELEKALTKYYDLAKSYGMEMSQTTAMDEVVADWVADHMVKGDLQWTGFLKQASRTQEGRGLLARIRTAIRDIISKLKGSNNADINQMTESLQKAQQLIDEALKAAERNVAEQTKNLEAKANDQEAFTADEEFQYSLRLNKNIFNAAQNWNENNRLKNGRRAVPVNVMTQAGIVMESMQQILEDPEVMKLLPNEENVLSGTKETNAIRGTSKKRSTVYGNESYGYSVENSTICTRSLAMELLLDRCAELMGHSLSTREAIALSQMAWSMTDQPTCQYCYVFADRLAQRQARDQYITQRDVVLKGIGKISAKTKIVTDADLITPVKTNDGITEDKFVLDQAIEANPKMAKQLRAYDQFLAGRKNTENQRQRFLMFLETQKSGVSLVTREQVASEQSMVDAVNDHPELIDQMHDIYDYANKASHAKAKVEYTAYNSDILKLSVKAVELMNREYGVRFYSYSDFHPAFILENMQMFLDASVRGLKGLAYTKDLDYVRIFADTGVNINISCKAIDGTTEMDAMQGADWEDAKQLREKYKNVGVVMVCTSDAQVEWALAQDWVDMVLPYHTCFSAEVGKAFNWNDYRQFQSDKKITGLWNKDTDVASISPYQHENDKEKYRELCKENHLEPRFKEWIDNPNYMKLVIETRQSYKVTKPLQPVFNLDAAKESIESMKKRGGYNNPFGGSVEEMNELAKDFVGRMNERFQGIESWEDGWAATNEFAKNTQFSLRSKAEEQQNQRYMDAVNSGDIETATRLVRQRARDRGFTDAIPEQTLAYKTRTGKAPRKTKTVYKVFTVDDQGRPSALFVSGVDALPQNVWLDAQDTWHFQSNKNGRFYVPSTKNPNTEGNKTGGTINRSDISDADWAEIVKRGFAKENSKSVTALAYRPGWHAGDLPFFPQGGVKIEGSNYENVHRFNQVVFECEMAYDVDYTKTHATKDGQVAFEDMQEMPENGGYEFATNPMARAEDIGKWFISSSLKIKRALTEEECNKILKDNGRLPQEWQAAEYKQGREGQKLAGTKKIGSLNLAALGYKGTQFDAARKTLAPVTYDDNGNVIPLEDRFDPNKNDARYSLRTNVGYHAGDLGKSEALSQQSSGRDTGHFGTGTYFVGNQAKIEGYNSRDGKAAPTETVDFSQYNLFKPKNYHDALALHDFMRYVDGSIGLFSGAKTTEEYNELNDQLYDASEEFSENGAQEVTNDIDDYFFRDNERSETARSDAEIIDDVVRLADNTIGRRMLIDTITKHSSERDTLSYDESYIYDEQGNRITPNDYLKGLPHDEAENIIDWIATEADDRRSFGRERTERYESWREKFGDVANILGISESELESVITEATEEADQVNYPESKTADSIATRVMKRLGYEGVDVRHIDQMDNTTYGSVIYDLKGEDLARKQEIGTARFSLRTSPEFYSQLERTIEQYKGDKIGAASVESYLKGRGVKDEEIKWTGIRTFLEGKKSVSKEDLLQYIRDNSLKIEESTLHNGMNHLNEFTDELWELGVSVDDFLEPMDDTFSLWRFEEWLDDYLEEGEIDKKTYDRLHKYAKELDSNETRWSEYTIPGGKNYREILYKIPGNDYTNWNMETHWGWEHNGVVVHARVQDFTAKDGGNVLFVEEIQSDWHNAGQKFGYGEENLRSKFNAYSKEQNDYVENLLTKKFGKKDTGDFLSGDRVTVGNMENSKYFAMLDAESDAKREWSNKNEEKYKVMQSINPSTPYVPDAPFKNNYTDFALKSLLRMAAEGDYRYLAWTSAAMQIERWSDEFAEGYRIEYDQDIPKFLKKYGKQWGASLTEVEIASEEYFDSFSETWKLTGRLVPAIEITDAMKESVLTKGQPMFSLRDVQQLTEENVRSELENALSGKYDKDTYLPVRNNTPSVLIESVKKYSGIEVKNLPFAMQVGKIIQTMSVDNSKTTRRPHGIDSTRMIQILRDLDAPDYIVHQRNGRYAEVINYNNGSDHTWVVVDFGAFIYDQYLNGYNGGEYNIVVTAFDPDDFNAYLSESEIIYKKGETGVGSGRGFPSRTETPFDGSNISSGEENVNGRQNSLRGSQNIIESAERDASIRNGYMEAATNWRKNMTAFNDFGKSGFNTNMNSLIRDYNKNLDEKTTEKIVGQIRQLTRDMVSDKKMEYSDIVGRANEIAAKVLWGKEGTTENLLFNEDAGQAIDDIRNDIMAQILKTVTRGEGKYQRLSQEFADYRKKANESISEVRQKRDARIDQMKQQKQAERERRSDSKERATLLKTMKRLDSISKHASEANKALIQELIGDFNKVSRSLTEGKADNLKQLAKHIQDHMSADPNFMPTERALRDLDRLSQKNIADLSIEEVRMLNQALLNIEHEMRTNKKLVDSNYRQHINEIGNMIIDGVQNTRGIGNSKYGVFNWFQQTLDKTVATPVIRPETEFLRLVGFDRSNPLYQLTYGDNNSLASGQRDMVRYKWQANKKYVDQFLNDRAFANEIMGKKARACEITGRRSDGKMVTLKVTPDMLMALYMHAQNRQNFQHFGIWNNENGTQYGGGITIPDFELYRKGKIQEAYRVGTRNGNLITMTKSSLNAAFKQLTEKEMSFVRAAQAYYSEMSQPEINRVSNLLLGYSIAQEENYFRINTDSNYRGTNMDAIKFDGTIEGMGWTKERMEGARNPILLISLTEQFARDIDAHAKYIGLAIPVRNFNKAYGVNRNSYTEDGEFRGTVSSVQSAITGKWGDGATDYIQKLMSDIQNPKTTSEGWSKIFGKLRSFYAGSVLALNAGVAIKQAASYPTAAAEIGWAPLIKAFGNTRLSGKMDMDIVNKYSPLMYLRTQGMGYQELADLKNLNKGWLNRALNSKALNWIQDMDVMTVKKLWKACEYYVRDNFKDLKVGTEEYYQKVGEMHSKVIERTQPNYTTLQRGEILRSDSDFVRMALGMFKTQPFQNFSVLFEATGELSAACRAYKVNPNETTNAMRKAAVKKMARALSSQLVASLIFAIMQAAWDWIRGRDDKYKDKEGNLSFASAFKQIGINMGSNAFGMIPLGSVLYEVIETTVDTISKNNGGDAIFNATAYGLDASTATGIINDMVDAIGTLAKNSTSVDLESKNTTEKHIRDYVDILAKTAQAFGYPAENFIKDGQAIALNVFRTLGATESMDKYTAEYYSKRIFSAVTSQNKKEYLDLLYRAYDNDKDAYNKLYSLYTENEGFATSSKSSKEYIDDKMKAHIKEQTTNQNRDKVGLSDSDMTKYQEYLDRYDANHNGKYTQEEVYNALMAIDLSMKQKETLWNENGWKKSFSEYGKKK